MNLIQFLKQFVVHTTKTGAIAPSSEGLADLITDTAGLDSASAVIEFGTGTGVFTEKILQKISNETRFFAIEINPDFVEATRKRCPEVKVYHDSASNAKKYLNEIGINECDCIICGLPWASVTTGARSTDARSWSSTRIEPPRPQSKRCLEKNRNASHQKQAGDLCRARQKKTKDVRKKPLST